MIIVMNVHTSYTCLFLNNNKQITRKDFVIGCNIRTWYIEFFDLAHFMLKKSPTTEGDKRCAEYFSIYISD
jgi:hypothetical protein